MDKINELTKKQKDEDRLFEAKVTDKIKQAQARNGFSNTDFLDLAKQEDAKKIIIHRKLNNCELFGGFDDAERKILFVFPENDYIDKNNYYNQIMSVIKIKLPKELYNEYQHKNYLGALIKLGIKREKIGDIIVRNDGADIIISKEIEKFLLLNLKDLTRFKKAEIQSSTIDNLELVEKPKELFKINVASMRLDCIVGELARCSRNDALDLIKQERVFVNFKEELSQGKQIKENTFITIRGKGRFKILNVLGNTRSGRLTVEVEK